MRTRTFAAVVALLATLLAGQTVASPAAHAALPPEWQKYKNYHSNLCLNVEEFFENYKPVFQDTPVRLGAAVDLLRSSRLLLEHPIPVDLTAAGGQGERAPCPHYGLLPDFGDGHSGWTMR